MSKFLIYCDSKKEWRWKVISRNGRIIGASSEGFKRRHGAMKNMRKLYNALFEETYYSRPI